MNTKVYGLEDLKLLYFQSEEKPTEDQIKDHFWKLLKEHHCVTMTLVEDKLYRVRLFALPFHPDEKGLSGFDGVDREIQ